MSVLLQQSDISKLRELFTRKSDPTNEDFSKIINSNIDEIKTVILKFKNELRDQTFNVNILTKMLNEKLNEVQNKKAMMDDKVGKIINDSNGKSIIVTHTSIDNVPPKLKKKISQTSMPAATSVNSTSEFVKTSDMKEISPSTIENNNDDSDEIEIGSLGVILTNDSDTKYQLCRIIGITEEKPVKKYKAVFFSPEIKPCNVESRHILRLKSGDSFPFTDVAPDGPVDVDWIIENIISGAQRLFFLSMHPLHRKELLEGAKIQPNVDLSLQLHSLTMKFISLVILLYTVNNWEISKENFDLAFETLLMQPFKVKFESTSARIEKIKQNLDAVFYSEAQRDTEK